jgi:hypothetical protein
MLVAFATHYRAGARWHRAILPHLTLPSCRMVDILEWICRTQLRQDLLALGHTLVHLAKPVLDE